MPKSITSYNGNKYLFATLRVYYTVGKELGDFVFQVHMQNAEPRKLEGQTSLIGTLAQLSGEGWLVVHVKEWQPYPDQDICEVWLQLEIVPTGGTADGY
jgi:hypothetical protein